MSDSNHKPSDGEVGSGGKQSYADAPITKFEHGDRAFKVRVITQQYRLLCPIDQCSKRYESERSLSQHLSQKHGIMSRYTVDCPVCANVKRTRRKRTYCSKSCAKKAERRDEYE